MLVCSRPGTYAFPPCTTTLRPSTRSGTLIQSTLTQTSSSTLALPPRLACRSSRSSAFSSAVTSSNQSSPNPATNAFSSLGPAASRRSRNSIVSTRVKRRRRSSVAEKARRRIKWL